MLHEATIRGVGVSVEEDGVGAPAVVLETRGEIVPIFVGGAQARTIERARQGVPAERPMTHDLFAGVLDDAGVAIERVRVDDLKDGTFYAKLDLVAERGDYRREFVRDARPSDGIALAVRVGCPVLIAGDVVDEAGRPPESLEGDRPPDDRRDSGPGGGTGPVGAAGGPPDAGGREGERADEDGPDDLDDPVDIDIEAPDDSDADPEPDDADTGPDHGA